MKNDGSLDSLATTSSTGKRVKLFPTEVKKGFWADRRFGVQWALIVFYLLLPWINIQGHPLLLLDIVHRRFSIFGTLFFAHEVPNLVFIGMSFLFFIGLVTTLWGRVWCGWSCPQTVFIDRIFRKLEYWIEGDFTQQKRLHAQSMDSIKFFRLFLKWVSFVVVTLILSHSFLAYFVGASQSFTLLTQAPSQNWGSFLFVLIFGGIILFDFGWFREQFCLIACPYGKMQSVMMDEGSLFLAYDEKRNDCIDCLKCVRVCPTGIDVRKGLQIECIACTACADACDSVMIKIKKPTQLIGYGSELSLQGKNPRFFRGRVILYGALLCLSLSVLGFRLSNRSIHQTEVIRAVDTPYQVVKNADGSKYIINHFKIRFYNLDWTQSNADFYLNPASRALGIELIRMSADHAESIESGAYRDAQFFLRIPMNAMKFQGPKKVIIDTHWNQNEVRKTEVNWVGPELGV